MFIKKEFSLKELQKKKGEKIILELVPLEGKRDVVGAKLLKCFKYIQEQLKEHDFVFKESWKQYPVKEEKGRSYVMLSRKYSKPKDLITDLIGTDTIKSRAKKVEI